MPEPRRWTLANVEKYTTIWEGPQLAARESTIEVMELFRNGDGDFEDPYVRLRQYAREMDELVDEVERLRAALPTETQRDYLYGLVIRDAGIRDVDAPHYKAVLDWIKALPIAAQTSPEAQG